MSHLDTAVRSWRRRWSREVLAAREWQKLRTRVPELGDRHIVCDWVRDDEASPFIDEHGFGQLLALVPDKVATSLQRAKEARAGRGPLLTAGLGYEECLSSIIVDGQTIASSLTESLLVPYNTLPTNYLQPGGIPGRTLVIRARGRMTTLTTAAVTVTFRWGSKITAPALTTPALSPTWCVSGAILTDTVAVQTATMWRLDAGAAVRSVGSAGTVFAMGDVDGGFRLVGTAAQNALCYMGSAGSATPATATVDMTVPQFLGLAYTCSVNTAYSITCHRYVLEALN